MRVRASTVAKRRLARARRVLVARLRGRRAARLTRARAITIAGSFPVPARELTFPRPPALRVPPPPRLAEFTHNEQPKALKLLDKGPCRILAGRVYRLRDRATGLSYENFELDDVRDGDTIQVNFELYDLMLVALEERRIELKKIAARRAQFAKRPSSLDGASSPGSSVRSDLSARASAGTTAASAIFRELSRRASKVDIRKIVATGSRSSRSFKITPEQYELLSFREKVWVFADVPSSGLAAAAFALVMLVLIVFSTVTFCTATLHGQYDAENSPSSFFYISEAICIVIFTLELLVRIWSTPDLKEYLKEPMNLVDIVAVLPFYVELCMLAAQSDGEVPGMSVFRVLRLVRVFRLLKVSRGSVDMFTETMSNSLRPLNMLLMLVSIALVVCGSLIYFIERGRWNADMMYWERPIAYDCAVRVVAEAGEPNLGSDPTFFAGYGNECDRESVAADERSAVFTCRFPFERGDDCVTVYAQSPFDSIIASFWWSWVTMATIGYGDEVPKSILGKAFGMLVMFFGILVIALPVTVIGSNFSTVYHRQQAEEAENLKTAEAAERRRQAEELAASRRSSLAQDRWDGDKSFQPPGPSRLSLRSPRTSDGSKPRSP